MEIEMNTRTQQTETGPMMKTTTPVFAAFDRYSFGKTSLVAAVALLAGGATATAGAQTLAEEGYTLIWEEQFDGDSLNLSNWEYMYGTGAQFGLNGWGNDELQYYTDREQNIRVENGELFITARRENFGGRQYTSARIRSFDRFTTRYGRIEASINLPVGEGLWPAFWMMPEDSVYGGWPLSGEIDIMEASQDANHVSGAIHFGNTWPGNQYRSSGINGNFGNSHHVYAVEWEPDRIRWYVDGELFMAQYENNWFSGAATNDPNAPFDQDFHILLNMAVGGNFVPNPSPSSPFPKTMSVDYVRVYEQLQTPFHGAPADLTQGVEAEDFDHGYRFQSYDDTSLFNEGTEYRREDGVDIEECSEGGYNIGFIEPGEWTEYTINIPQSGLYRIDARVASASNGGSFRLLFDGADYGADFIVPSTGGWQNWVTTTAEIEIAAGDYVMRFESTTQPGEGFNLNWFSAEQTSGPCIADVALPQGVLDLNDISVFSNAFINQIFVADLAEPFGTFDLADISAFVSSFLSGCP